MSQRRSRRRPPVTVGKRQRRTFLRARRFSEPHKASKLLNRCSSEPTLKTMISSEDLSLRSDGNGVFYRPQTCYEIFPSSLSIMDCSPRNQNARSGYSREAKVLVKVEVEGSPGPVRIMVKLGCSINDTIKLVIHKYDEERRTPKIHLQAASSFELHSSNFSLQSLDKSAAIGDVGSRNFYLRKSNEETPVMSYPPRPTSSPGFISREMGSSLSGSGLMSSAANFVRRSIHESKFQVFRLISLFVFWLVVVVVLYGMYETSMGEVCNYYFIHH